MTTNSGYAAQATDMPLGPFFPWNVARLFRGRMFKGGVKYRLVIDVDSLREPST